MHREEAVPLQVAIRPAAGPDLEWCVRLMVENDPWKKYECSEEWCRRVLGWRSSSLYIADRERAAGFLLLHQRGFLGSPYIAAIAVAEEFRGARVGSALIEFAEQEFRPARHAFLCVASFNARARQLYERHGYRVTGELKDFMAEGTSEFLMCKRLCQSR
jgi:ribosomal protein S18 acetylase RimI-like enzyme